MTPSEFVWADAPLSSVQAPATAAVCYTLFVLLLARLKPSVETKPLQAVHNLILCGMSAAMALGTLREVVARSSSESSVRWLFCENPATQVRRAARPRVRTRARGRQAGRLGCQPLKRVRRWLFFSFSPRRSRAAANGRAVVLELPLLPEQVLRAARHGAAAAQGAATATFRTA
eukprot:1992749-Prymnesium_polylepis.1